MSFQVEQAGPPSAQAIRKVKFSANWKKERAKIGRLHSHIANIRRELR